MTDEANETPSLRLGLLAAGFAKRMYPLTRDRAKPLLEVGGRPMSTRLIDQALESGPIDGVGCVCASRFEDEFRGWQATLPTEVRLVPNGAGTDAEARGAIRDLQMLLRDGFASGSTDGYLILAGDNLLRFPLTDARALWAEDPSRPLFLVRRVPEPIPPGKYSEVTLDGDAVTGFREKPQDPKSPYSAIGVYFLPPNLPELVDRYLAGGGEVDAPGHFMSWLCSEVEGSRAYRVPDGGWYDVGSLEGYDAVQSLFES